MKTIRIGSGAGYSGDRIEPAVELAERGALDYLGFECLAERTIALAQVAKRAIPPPASIRCCERACARCCRPCVADGMRIITNMGAANPHAAALADGRGRPKPRHCTACGSRPSPATTCWRSCARGRLRCSSDPGDVASLGDTAAFPPTPIWASPAIVDALRGGADVVITGRVGDPALVRGAAGARVRLGDGRLGPAGPGHGRRPSPGMRGPDHRRLFRRSRLQGRSRARAPRLSRSARSPRTARRCSPRSPAPADASTCRPARSNFSTSCTTPPRIFSPT